MTAGGQGNLTADQVERYARHLVLEDVGPEGQAALRAGSVLVVGAGGLGSPVIQYLTAAGIGRLGVIDDDVVERSNLQRQVIHGEGDVGRRKVDSAADYVRDRNPEVDVRTHATRLEPETAELLHGYDVVVDAADNFPTRYLVNDACELAGIPHVFAAVDRFHGQVSTFRPAGPCYRCLFPAAPPPGTVADCATAGVLGVLPGTVGCLEATEAMKLVLSIGEPLDGRLLVYDARAASVETVSILADPDCPVCGTDPAIASVEDGTYADRCRL